MGRAQSSNFLASRRLLSSGGRPRGEPSGEDAIPESGVELEEVDLALPGVLGPAAAEEELSVLVMEATSLIWEAARGSEGGVSEGELNTVLLRLRDGTEAIEDETRSGGVSEGSNPDSIK